ASTARRPAASRRARPARSTGPSTGPSTSTRTSATAAGTASPPVPSASSPSTTIPAPRRSAPSATTGSTTASGPPARRRARPSRSGSASATIWPASPRSGSRSSASSATKTPSSTARTRRVTWPVLIDLYFFLGGIAGGAFVIATIANLLGHERYRDIVRVGYYIAFLAVIPGPLILTVDLGLPTRFLHMLMVAKPSLEIGRDAVTVGPFHLKPFSPMNAGAWALLAFSACAFLAALDVFLEHRGGRSMRTFRGVVGVIGTFFGFFLAAYPGVLIGATARPLFVSAHWLGALFLAVGASTGGAAIALILSVLGATRREALSRLMRFTAFALVVQLATLALFILSVSTAG